MKNIMSPILKKNQKVEHMNENVKVVIGTVKEIEIGNVIGTGNVVDTERVALKIQKQAIKKKGNINTSLIIIVLEVVVMKNVLGYKYRSRSGYIVAKIRKRSLKRTRKIITVNNLYFF
uniref:Uncharacterized protein n=1 Tax=Sipha flava TaxID=143950 RepID=A0A2S2R9G9_9HEMI